MTFSADIHGPLRMNPTDFGDPLISPLAPPRELIFVVLSEVSQQLLDGLS